MKKCTKNTKKQFGFTLVELLVYFGLFSILLVVMTSVFISMLEQRTEDTAQSFLQQESQYLLTKLKSLVYEADTIVLPADPGDSGTSLSFQAQGVTKTLFIDSGRLVYQTTTESWYLTSPDVTITDFQVVNQTGTSVHQGVGITVVLQSSLPQQRESLSRVLSTTLAIR